jgi:glutaredoxin 3
MLRLAHATRRAAVSARAFSSSVAAPAAPAASAQDWIDDADKGRVLLFGKTWCGFSQMALGALEAEAVDPHVVQLDLEEHGEAMQRELHELTGMATVPSVWIDGRFIGGYTELSRVPKAELRRMLDEAGAFGGE